MIQAFILGFLSGFVAAVPVAGPISALVLNRGLAGNYSDGWRIAFGGAIAEAVYALLAFLGFNAFLSRYAFIVPLSHGVAALILAGLGIQFLRMQGAKTAVLAEAPTKPGYGGFMLGFAITAFNPTLIATWTAGITTLYSADLFAFSVASSIAFSSGVLLGIVAWFNLFLLLLARFRGGLADTVLNRSLRIIGALLIGLSLFFAWKLATHFRS